MVDGNQEESHTRPLFIDREEAWEILNNQITVQEQLRTRGQQVLKILSALAVIGVGTSFSPDYSISDTAFENTLASTSISEELLRGFLFDHQIISVILLVFSFMYFISFVVRNYEASRHSSLRPSLGKKNEPPIFVAATHDYRDLLNGNQIIMQYYGEWITSNSKVLENKRQQLGIANMSLVLLIDCLLMMVSLLNYSSNASIEGLLYIDLFLLLQISAVVLFYSVSRDKWLDWSSWPLTEQQKENFYFLNTKEFAGTILLCVVILISLAVVFYWHLPALFA